MSQDSQGAPPLDTQRIIEVLDRHGVDYVLVGGVAARLHGARRMTMDVDLCPAWHEDNLARLARALIELEATLKGLPPTVTLPPITASMLRTMDVGTWRTTAGDVDILQGIPADKQWRLSEFETLKVRAMPQQVGGCNVYVAALADLVTSKRVAARPADLEVLPELEALLDPSGSLDLAYPPRGMPPSDPAGHPLPPPVSRPEHGLER